MSATARLLYHEGDRCEDCGYWWWDGESAGWHSLVPKPWLGRESEARIVCCPVCAYAASAGVSPPAEKEPT